MSNRNQRHIRERWIIEGTLELLTPTSLSNGDDDPSVALPLLSDSFDGRPLLTGASLAGALRSYVRDYFDSSNQAQVLFGGARGSADQNGRQSPLIVEDALAADRQFAVEIRDGVRIDPKTRTAADSAKYDTQLLAAGTQFNIGFDLLITDYDDKADLTNVLAVALRGLERGDIPLGGRKRRGYGRCQVTQWTLWRYDLQTAAGMAGWLTHGREGLAADHAVAAPQNGTRIATLLGANETTLDNEDSRQRFEVTAKFEIDGSVLIRSGFENDNGPDMAHLESRRRVNGQLTSQPILSGTSLAGVIRAQAQRIAHTVLADRATAEQLIINLFGYMPWQAEEADTPERRKASKITVHETTLTGGKKLVQSRVAIDRFTGGALESALFEQQPYWGGQATIHFSVRQPKPEEMGVLLLVLKDLWTGFIPIGGEASVGRGRLKGVKADITLHHNKTETDPAQEATSKWHLHTKDNDFIVTGDLERLEEFVTAFHQTQSQEVPA